MSEKRRSDQTKAAIIRAARARFSADGYERATIRAIAADASIDPSMVMRYFTSKERLFASAADLDLGLPDLTPIPRDRIGEDIARHFLDRWESDQTVQALLRAAATNESVADRARELFTEQVRAAIATVISDPREADLRAGLVGSQILGMALCRYVLRLPPVVSMSRAELVGWIGPTLQRYVTGDPDLTSGVRPGTAYSSS